jgi:hypothetical protein
VRVDTHKRSTYVFSYYYIHVWQEEEEVAESDAASVMVSEKQHGDGKIERVFADGKKLLIFSNGTRKFV